MNSENTPNTEYCGGRSANLAFVLLSLQLRVTFLLVLQSLSEEPRDRGSVVLLRLVAIAVAQDRYHDALVGEEQQHGTASH